MPNDSNPGARTGFLSSRASSPVVMRAFGDASVAGPARQNWQVIQVRVQFCGSSPAVSVARSAILSPIGRIFGLSLGRQAICTTSAHGPTTHSLDAHAEEWLTPPLRAVDSQTQERGGVVLGW